MGNRDKGIEIYFTSGMIPEIIKQTYDIEYSSKENSEMLWVHSDGFKAINKEIYAYLANVTKVYNRHTQTDHLNLFVLSDEIDQYGLTHNGIKYKNITWAEISTGAINISDTLLRREVLNL